MTTSCDIVRLADARGPVGASDAASANRIRSAPRARRRRVARRGRRGFVIVVVTVVILLVSLAAYGFLSLMQVENQAARARGDQIQAEAVAMSGREYLAAILELPRSARPQGVEDDDAIDVLGDLLIDGEADRADRDERQGRCAVLAPAVGEMATRSWRCGYENESAKLHLGMLLEWDRQQPGAGRRALLCLDDMDESTADAILDWVDADDAPRELGAEASYYSSLDYPVRPRNAVPPSLDELLLVRGVTRGKLFGLDWNASFDIEDWEADLDSAGSAPGSAPVRSAGAGGDAQLPWCRCLTVCSAERDESYEGEPRIVLNQTDLGALHQQLAAVLEPSWANFVVAYRQYGPYTGAETGEAADALPLDLAPPPQHNIASPLELVAARVAIPTGEQDKQKVYASPFGDDPAQLRESLPKLMDRVTAYAGTPIVGRVNVNLAPRAVLAAIPGFDNALAERVISTRALVGSDDAARQHAAWLLTEGVVERQRMQELDPWVTAGGDVGRAQIIGYYDLRSPFARFETAVDGTVRPARQVYYKDLRPLGRGVLGDVINVTKRP